MGQSYLDLDVRPILRDGGEPFSVIMAALAKLEPAQGIRLYATFKPIPLFAVWLPDSGSSSWISRSPSGVRAHRWGRHILSSRVCARCVRQRASGAHLPARWPVREGRLWTLS